MKTSFCFPVITILFFVFAPSKAQKSYILISQKTSKVNINLAATLPPHLKAIAAFYSAMGGTGCKEDECTLTNALGFGKQGSEAQKKIIQKFFPDDRAAELVVGQDCYLPPEGSSSFSKFQSLSLIISGETVQVNYILAVYDHGNTKMIHGPDIYLYKNQIYQNKKRVLFAWTNKKGQ